MRGFLQCIHMRLTCLCDLLLSMQYIVMLCRGGGIRGGSHNGPPECAQGT